MSSPLLSLTVKELSDDRCLPPLYKTRSPGTCEDDDIITEADIPTIDFALLRNGSPDERLRIIHDIGLACKEWGCFTLINHGVPESLRTAMIEAFAKFFELPREEKRVYETKGLFDSVSHGSSFSLTTKEDRYWKDYLRMYLHTEFNPPEKPAGFSATSKEYARQTVEICSELLRAVWESLELEASLMEETLQQNSSCKLLVGSFYPPCPQPELVLGLPTHTDPSYLTLVTQNNAFNGLQVFHGGKWVVMELVPDSFLILIGDFLEIVSNGMYKSILHRATVSEVGTRISILTSICPPLENVAIAPASKLAGSSTNPTKNCGITFKELVALKLQKKLDEF